MSQSLKWEATDTTDQQKAVKAFREARKILKEGPVVLYRFPNGKWSWASKNSPIHSQLVATGEIYQTVPASKWFTVQDF